MSTIETRSTQAAADTPQPPNALTPEEAVEQLKALVAQIPEIPELTPQQRELVRRGGYLPLVQLQAAISVVGASELIAQAVDMPAEDVRALLGDMPRWEAVANAMKGALKAINDANLVRRQRANLIAVQAYGVAQQLVKLPKNADIVPHVEGMKRLKALKRRSKGTTTPEPAPVPATEPVPNPKA
jgi:hypothetical protein